MTKCGLLEAAAITISAWLQEGHEAGGTRKCWTTCRNLADCTNQATSLYPAPSLIALMMTCRVGTGLFCTSMKIRRPARRHRGHHVGRLLLHFPMLKPGGEG